jgi:hypothetical protein
MEAHRARGRNIGNVNDMNKSTLRMGSANGAFSVELPGDLAIEGDCAWTLVREGHDPVNGTLPVAVVRVMRDALEAMGRDHANELMARDACIARLSIKLMHVERQ